MQRPSNGHGRAGEEAQKVVEYRKESRDCGVEGGDGPDHGAAVSGTGPVAQRTKKERPWRTREDPFGEVWDAVFEWLQREYPDRFSDGQIRTLQRRIKLWRVLATIVPSPLSAFSGTCQSKSGLRLPRAARLRL